jgi:hypothetical protein
LDELKAAVRDPDSELTGLYRDYADEHELDRLIQLYLSSVVSRMNLGQPKSAAALMERTQRPQPITVGNRDPFEGMRALERGISSFLEDKACLTLKAVGIQTSRDNPNAIVTIEIRNEGRGPAMDIRCAIDTGDGFNPLSDFIKHAPLASIKDDLNARAEWKFGFPKPTLGSDGDALPGQYRSVRLRLEFRDLIGTDTATFTLLFRNNKNRSDWNVEEDGAEAEIAGGCRQTRPRTYEREDWPKNLTSDEHAALRELLRRLQARPDYYLPSLRLLPAGDDKYPMNLEQRSNATNSPGHRMIQLDRDITSLLVSQGFIEPMANDQYAINESLVRAYGLLNSGG